MSSTTIDRGAPCSAQPRPTASSRVVLLGCGTVGSAFARLSLSSPPGALPLHITGALVRDAARVRACPPLALSDDAEALLGSTPDVVVELLGGVEPARTLVRAALGRGIPVVTANKALLARHGGELRALAHEAGTRLLYEAAVLAGVPFLGTFSRRPRAAAATGLVAIANGTSNYVLTRCAIDGCAIDEALADAQRRGYAEPDPRSDVSGADARDKLGVLLQHFAHLDVPPGAVETLGLDAIGARQPSHARELGGTIKPLIFADWGGAALEAFVGPAFVPADHPLAHVAGVDNALVLDTPHGRLIFQGPGAGAETTAVTVLDDVQEVLGAAGQTAHRSLTPAVSAAPETGWLLTIEASRLPAGDDVADLLASHGLFAHRVSAVHTEGARESRSLLLWPAHRARVQRVLDDLAGAAGCTASALRTIGEVR